ncbi:MAG: AMP-binding protein [Verrucomicrobiota bacterium]
MGRSEIEALQLAKLQSLIETIQNGQNGFYQSRLEAAGLDSSVKSIGDFVGKMPFTSKLDIVWDREECPPYGSNLTFPIEEYSRFCQSSGTTSASGALPWLDTADSWSVMLDCWEKVFASASVEEKETIFFAFSFGPFLGFWTAYDCATRRGNLCIPGGGLSSLARLRLIDTHRAKVLCCTPTYALRLGELLQQQDPSEFENIAVEKIIVAGEPGGSIPEVRDRLAELWGGAQIFDHHGMTEVGPVTYEHAEKPLSLCVIEEHYLAEVIDHDSLEEVAPGGKGELVLTTLGRSSCPLLRYRTGDLVMKTYHGDVLCLEGGILGRVDDMAVIRGVNIYPSAVEKVIRGFTEISEFRVEQTTRQSMAELEVTVEPFGEVNPSHLQEKVARALQDTFALRIPVHVVEPGALPRFEFKSKRWVKSG